MNKTAVALCVLAVTAMLVSANALSWRKGAFPVGLGLDVPVRVGLLGMEICAPSILGQPVLEGCERMGFEATTDGQRLPPQKMFFVVASKLTYALSIAASVLLIGALFVGAAGGWTRPIKAAAFTSAAFSLSSVAAIATWTGADLAVGWAFWVALVGGGLGAVAAGALLMPTAEESGGELAPSLRARLEERERAAARPPEENAAAKGPPRLNRVTRSEPSAAGNAYGHNPLRNSLDVVNSTGVDAISSTLRFCAREVELRDRGMTVTGHDDQLRFVEYSHIAGIVVRALPPDPPFEGRLLVDLVPTPDSAGRRWPVRLLPNTRVNYAALPQGVASTSNQNLRNLVDFVVGTQPNIVRDPDLTAFLAGSPPRRFAALKEFTAYDAGFTPG